MIRLDRFVAETTEMTRSVASKAIRGGQVSVNNTIVRSPEMKIDEDADVPASKKIAIPNCFFSLCLAFLKLLNFKSE